MVDEVDVVIAGAGPAGATTAGLLAKRGYRVLALERERFPRYHIGESTVPGILPVLEELGLADEVAARGFVPKPGVTLLWGRYREPWSFYFGESGQFDHAYQVVRADFDHFLVQHARRLGAMILEETSVTGFAFEGDRCVGVEYVQGRETSRHSCRARFVVDATGQDAVLSRRFGFLEYDQDLKNVAIWAYYQGGSALDGKNAGNILVENTPEGWLWVIPLHDGTQSVGWVTPAVNAGGGRENLENAYLRHIAESVETRRLLASASRVSAFRTARDWSYQSRRMYGSGYLLAGDAAGFVDPLFSTGVFLAMSSASLAARTLTQALREPAREKTLFERYDETYKKTLGVLTSFVHYFYDASRDKETYWAHAQELIDPRHEMAARADFLELVSGLHGIRNVMSADPEAGRVADSPAIDSLTPRDIISALEAKLAREPARTAGIEAVYQFVISGEHGGKWYVEISNGKASVVEGEFVRPGCTIAIKDVDYVAMATGRLSGPAAFLSGKLRIAGDGQLAMKARGIFS